MLSNAQSILVVIAQGQSRSPEKRSLEEDIANSAARLRNVSCLVVPHLYDLGTSSQSLGKLQAWEGPIVLMSWLFDRAAFWVLDRNDIRGQRGLVELINPDFQIEDDEEDGGESKDDERAADRVSNLQPRPERPIYSIDLRASQSSEAFFKELTRIAQMHSDVPITQISSTVSLNSDNVALPSLSLDQLLSPARVDEHPQRRWYPVIDYSRCTNCMECIDFCLFGVYGVDRAETILVEQPDNCRKGCPACSRVCPENAIIFPQHKTPAIAGAPVDGGGFKIDLSKLFGAPELNEDPTAAAARERDEQLMLVGRAPVGASVTQVDNSTSRNKQPLDGSSSTAIRAKDKLDDLIDQLDLLDL